MNRSSLRTISLHSRRCRNSATPFRVRRNESTERLDKQWCELRLHATIERDAEKLLRLAAEIDKRKRQAEALGRRNRN
jgi:hypothetical protein